MMHLKTQAEVELMRESSQLVSATHAAIAGMLKAGVTTKEVDELAEKFILEHNGIPSFKNYNGFPFACCISVNDAVVHGFPSDYALKDGDIVTVDIGVFKNGFHGDSAYTFAIGTIDEETQRLLRVTKASLYKGIEQAVTNNRVGDVAFAVQDLAERKNKFGVVRELVGHGIGRRLHEDPQVPNYGKRGSGPKLKDGLVIAIEPMVNMGVKEVFYDDDGWTVRTKDGKLAAHFEHTICVRKGKADILSNFEVIEAAEKNNPHLFFTEP